MSAAVYLRTHRWDEAVAHCQAAATRALGAPVTVVADKSQPFALPKDLPSLSFRREDLDLPLLPTPERALWFNGDYVLSLLARKDPSDYLLMMDGDCCVNGLDLAALVARLEAAKVDFCAPYLSVCAPGEWAHWAGVQRAWFAAELGPDHGLPVYKSFFPFVWISRRAALHLHDRRLQMARRTEALAHWPQCESFVPSELARLPGYRMAPLSDFVTERIHMTFARPIGLSELPGVQSKLVHPLLTGQRLGQKLLASVVEQVPDDPAGQVALVRRMLKRDLDQKARIALRQALANLQP